MKRLLSRLVLMAIGAASIGVVGGGQVAHAITNCPPDIVNTTVNGSVVVPAGLSCTISNSTVMGSVTVRPGANLVILGSTINNSLSGQPGSIRIDAIGPCTFPPTSCTRQSAIGGSVSLNHTASTPSGFSANYICNGTTITGSLGINYSGASAPWAIGDPNVCSFGGNSIGGSVTLRYNEAKVAFDNNSVSGYVTARNNTGGGEVKNNQITESLTVKPNSPCWIVSGNTVGGSTTAQPCP
jgi:hypothetical protein